MLRQVVDLTEDKLGARAFNLPLCFVEKDFFEVFPMAVSDDESSIIRRLDEEGRRKHLASSMVGLMKVTEIVVVITDEGIGLLPW